VEDGSILLVLPVPFRLLGGVLHFELQACNGAARWAEKFPRGTRACPLRPEALAAGNRSMQWKPTASIEHMERMRFEALPWAYGLGTFVREWRRTRRRLAELIEEHDYLHFAIGGLIGDWAAQGALLAERLGRPFSVWTDQVYHLAVRATGREAPRLRSRVWARMTVPLMRQRE